MVLADTSVWIAYFNGVSTWQTERLDLLLDTEPVVLGDLYQYHLQIETPRSNLSEAIKWLNVSYVSWFNREGALRDDWRQIGRWKKCLKDSVKS